VYSNTDDQVGPSLSYVYQPFTSAVQMEGGMWCLDSGFHLSPKVVVVSCAYGFAIVPFQFIIGILYHCVAMAAVHKSLTILLTVSSGSRR